MTSAELIEYLKTEALVAGIAAADLDARSKRAAQFGVADFWQAWPWTFRVSEYEHAVTSGESSSSLPNNFAAIKSIRETNSTYGKKLQFLEKEEFDRVMPKPASETANDPWYFTVYFHLNDGRHKIQFNPRPNFTGDISMVIYLRPPGDVSEVPEGAVEGIVSTCCKYIYKWGSPEQVAISRQSYFAIERLKITDKVNQGKIHRLAPDPGEQSIKSRGVLWVDSWLQ